ncbi:hypothetical protein F0562_029288 [Nyssa sinensis]|uniref:Pectinesterase n=1 Tax=Nyssa sinensis TaxID=561372 RepID=A0A5J5B2M4_9ASTE|nr:hypothetical protein F0562_029288 [Nyssa sinensis]
MADSGGRRRKVAVVGVSSIVVVAMVVAVAVGFDNHNKQSNHQNVSTSMKFIHTLFPTFRNTNNTIPNSPKDPIRIGFQVAISQIQEAVKNSIFLRGFQRDPRITMALDDCKELADFAMDDLQRSFDELANFDGLTFNDLMADILTWLSGAVTNQETCLDGFENTTGVVGDRVREFWKAPMQLTSNGLAMVAETYSALSVFDASTRSRRLLSTEELPVVDNDEQFPSWVNAGKRRLLRAKPNEIKPDLVVAKDGTGKYKTINEALQDIPKKNVKTFVLYIKEGVYEEQVQFNRSLNRLMIMGDGPTKTRITGRLNFIDGTPTFHTATVIVLGSNFIAKDIGFENTAGPEKHQAVALRVGADMSIFYNCRMDGYQDTLYVHTYRQFYRDCTITGTIDFIFGDSAALFQNCLMLVRKPMDNQQCIVTAQGRKEKHQATGIVLQNCTITADPSYLPVKSTFKSYLGRPWKEYSRTIIMESYIDDLIMPEGWLPWNGNFALDTLNYAEFNNRGPGSSKTKRVRWRGIKEIAPNRIQQFTPSVFLWGNSWIPQTGVPYAPGLIFSASKDNPNGGNGGNSSALVTPPVQRTDKKSPEVQMGTPKPGLIGGFKKFFRKS